MPDMWCHSNGATQTARSFLTKERNPMYLFPIGVFYFEPAYLEAINASVPEVEFPQTRIN